MGDKKSETTQDVNAAGTLACKGAAVQSDKNEGPTLSQIMTQLKVILAEQSVIKSCINVCNGKIDGMQKHLRKQEELMKACTVKIESFERQKIEILKENEALRAHVCHLDQNSQINSNVEVPGPSKNDGNNIVAVVEASANSQTLDYYWKEYTGEVPEEALPGGTDSQGRTTYIGQTIDHARVVPGELDPMRKLLIYTMAERQNVTNRNIKILCVHTPSSYEWIRTNIKEIRFLNQKYLIAGGKSEDYPYLLGRTVFAGRIIVGKIYYEKFAYAANDNAYYTESNFEVLSYNPKSPTKITIPTNTGSVSGNSVYNINIS